MARAKLLLQAGLLLACLAASVLASSNIRPAAVYDCPDTPRMKGCAATGCALYMHGRSSTLVCAQCKDEKAYMLVNQDTRKAQCECAPGYAGKGQDGVCKKCPAGTDIAEGGAISKSVCMKCPQGSFVNEEGTNCLCPAGTYRAAAEQAPGFRRIACKPCAARTAFMAEEGHASESCNTCKAPQVANKEHTGCVLPDDADAAPPGDSILGAVSKRAGNTPLGSLAQAFEEGRMAGQEQRLNRAEGLSGLLLGGSPLKSLAQRVRGAVGSRAQDKAESAKEEEVEQEEDAETRESKPSKRGGHKHRKHRKADEYEESEDSEEYVADKYAEKYTDKKEQAEAAPEAEEEEEKVSSKVAEPEPVAAVVKPQPKAEEATKPERQMSKPVSEETTEPAKQQQQPAAAEKPAAEKPAAEKPAPAKKEAEAPKVPAAAEAPKQAAEKKTEQPAAAKKPAEPKPEPKRWSDKVDPNLGAQLIPGMPSDPAEPPKVEAPAAPTGPLTLRDLAKKVGAAFGQTAPSFNPVSAAVGYIDPEALADAGLPPVHNVHQLMGALMKGQIGDLDLNEWSNGVRGGQQQ